MENTTQLLANSPRVSAKFAEPQAHKPGPWMPDEGRDDLWVYAAAYPVCRVRAAKPDHEDWANARLIASAPDMLAALQALALETVNIDPHYTPDVSQETRDMIRAAIAKATGEA